MRALAIAWPLVAALVLVMLLAGCDNRRCESGHTALVPVTHLVGKSVIVTLTPVYVCDKYAPQEPTK